MFLIYTAENRDGIEKEYSWWYSTMEYALDVLSLVSQKGKRIYKAQLVDTNYRIDLPVDAFNGEVISAPIYELEREWQQLLATPDTATADLLTEPVYTDRDFR